MTGRADYGRMTRLLSNEYAAMTGITPYRGVVQRRGNRKLLTYWAFDTGELPSSRQGYLYMIARLRALRAELPEPPITDF